MTVSSPAYLLEREIAAFRTARRRKDADAAWTALERAHIISQPALGPHLRVHWLMFGFAVRLRQPREVAGQALRLALAPLGAITGRVPWGNTGRAGVSAFERMPLPSDLAAVLLGSEKGQRP